MIDPVIGEWSKIFTNLGSMGLVCWILYYGITNTLPAIHKQFAAQLTAERKACQEQNEAIRNEMSKMYAELVRMQDTLASHLRNLERHFGREEPGPSGIKESLD